MKPVTQALQAIQLDLLSVQKFFLKLADVFIGQCENAKIYFQFHLFIFQPVIMKLDRAEFKISVGIIDRSYAIDNFEI